MAPFKTPTITIRHASPDDEIGLIRLAALDSAGGAPPRPQLLAEVDGELRAALSLRDGSAIADPFFATADLLELLRLHAAATTASKLRPRRLERTLRLSPSPLSPA